MLDRITPPPAVALDEEVSIPEPKSFVLDNGIPLHILLSGPQPLIRLEVIFEAGSWVEQKNNTAYLTSKLLSSGTHSHTAEQIENKIAFYGSFIDFESNADRITITLYSLSKYLPDLLPLIHELITDSVFPEEELNNLKKITSQNLKINSTKTSYLASVNFKEKCFGTGHPYGRSLKEGNLEALQREDLIHYYRKFFNHKNCHIILSGNGSLDFFKLINDQFGLHPWGEAEEVQPVFKTIAQPGKFHIVKEESLQSSLRVGRELFTIAHPDYLQTYFLIEVLGGYFGSRLMKNIREEKGYTYGIHANLISHKHTGYLAIGTDVNKENNEETIEEIFKEIDLLKKELVSPEEMDTVKNYLLGTFFNSMTTPFALADKFKTIYFHQLDYSFYRNYINTIRTITSEDVLKKANQYLQRDKMIEIIAG